MKPIIGSMLVAVCTTALSAGTDTRCYEMRVYHAAPGKLGAIEARFRDHTCALFEKHGFTNIGYWVPIENADNVLIYIISSPNREAHDQAWKGFAADPEWKEVVEKTEANGKLVTKVDSIYLTATDFSPEIRPSQTDEPRAFELRTYTPAEGKMDALLARFREHTVKLFEKHGMTNVGYWISTDKENERLIYILAHESKDAGAKSFAAFRADPDWIAAKSASEKDGPLTIKVESTFMAPLDFSATR